MSYLLITVVSSVFLFYILSENLLTIKYDQTLDMSNQVLTTVDSYLKSKISGEKSIHKKLLQDTSNWNRLLSYLGDEDNGSYYEDYHQQVRRTVTTTAYSIDIQFVGIFFYGSQGGNSVQIGTSSDLEDYNFFLDRVRVGFDDMKNNDLNSKLVSGRKPDNASQMFSLFIFDSINDPQDFTQEIGTMAVSFNAMNIRQSYRDFDKHIKGMIYVLDEAGGLLFDSSASYQVEEVFPLARLSAGGEHTATVNNVIYNSVYNEAAGYYIINAIPMNAIREDVRLLQISIFRVMAVVLLMALLVNYGSTKFFSKRIKVIKETMEQVKSGKLTNFKIRKHYDDEVGFIFTELIEMCAVLDNHIKREYIYQLRQKEMELYALQAQINPHFLYNTLEAIRMNLYVKGEMQASNMIYILSEMFRNMMKEEVVITTREEIRYVNSYLELYKFRLGARMRYELEIEDEIYEYATLKHILQPVIENALVHGIRDSGSESEPAMIRITVCMQDGDIIFIVQDDGSGMTPECLSEIRENLKKEEMFQNSVGIYNVNNRLKIVYGSDYQIQMESKEQEGTKVILRIKAMTKKELESYVRSVDC